MVIVSNLHTAPAYLAEPHLVWPNIPPSLVAVQESQLSLGTENRNSWKEAVPSETD